MRLLRGTQGVKEAPHLILQLSSELVDWNLEIIGDEIRQRVWRQLGGCAVIDLKHLAPGGLHHRELGAKPKLGALAQTHDQTVVVRIEERLPDALAHLRRRQFSDQLCEQTR